MKAPGPGMRPDATAAGASGAELDAFNAWIVTAYPTKPQLLLDPAVAVARKAWCAALNFAAGAPFMPKGEA